MYEWELNIQQAPRDGTQIEVKFKDEKGEHPPYPVAIAWDSGDKCWRNLRDGVRIDANIARWRIRGSGLAGERYAGRSQLGRGSPRTIR